MKIRDFLKIKDRPVVTIGPDETISLAIQKLVENNIGALPVCDEKGMLLGIISERDLLKAVFQHADATGSTKVRDVMTKDVAIARPEDELDYAAVVMKHEKIRHLPVVVNKKLQGIVSMRDIVSRQLMEAELEIRYLKSW